MSGITPLLDTLLHQVLGKRVDTQPPQDLNQPVKPTSPANAPHALHSDSRLDARAGAAAAQGTARTPDKAPDGLTRPAHQDGMPLASSQTHLSTAGRTIADLLVRFPAPPSTLTTKTPLVPAGQASNPTQVASRLEGSIRDSGLFYESHLSRWYKGELPRQQLEREPQMWRTLRFSPAAAPSTGTMNEPRFPLSPDARPLDTRGAQRTPQGLSSAGSATTNQPSPPSSSLPATTTTPASSPPLPTGAGQASDGIGNEAMTPRQPLAALPEPVHESLQGIIRHQLEMLAAPALRWEGDIWSGLFMALLIQPPIGQQESREGAQDDPAGEESQRTWRSDIDLEVQGAGRIKATVWMQASRLEVDMSIADRNTLEHLQEGLALLQARLEKHGFENADITLRRLTTEAPDATA